jgi:RHS repeat-associated protein
MQSLRQDLLHHTTCRLLALIDLVPTTATLRLKTAASCSFRWARLPQVLAAASLLLAAFSAWAAPSIGGVQITPNAIAAGVPTTVRVTATITDPTAIPASVNLQRVSDAGAVVAVVGPLRDDGLNGDAIAGDQVYTLDAVFTETTPVQLRVSAGFKGMLRRLFSASVLLDINRPPLADAGPDQRVALGKLVVLDGSASLDPEGVPLIYTWSLIGRPVGSSAVLAGANSARATFTADRPGDYFAQLIVSDGQLASAPDAVSITVIHTPPTVSLTAPDEGSVHTLPVTVTLTAMASGAEVNTPISRVDFYQGTTLIGGSTASPYTIFWTPTTAGSYVLTAKATDSAGGVTTSAPHSITVQAANALPAVSLVSPIVNQNFTAPANVTLTATASDTDGTVNKVEFFQGATLIGTATAAPYTVTWNSVPAGSYSLTAKATDDLGGMWTSAARTITVTTNLAPTVNLTAPAAGASYVAPAAITLSATAADTDGTIAKVEFFQGATLIGTATAAPYAVAWSNVPAGSYSLTAKATDDRGSTTTSAARTITVNATNTPPTVSLTAPADGAVYTLPATVTVSATAHGVEVDTPITRVDFYQGTTLIGGSTASPYTISWTPTTAGSYSLTAKATDSAGGVTTSTARTVTAQAGNQAPNVSLTRPLANQSFTTPATVTLSATASDADGSVAKVEFFQGATLIGSAIVPPYSAVWSNVPVGSYSLTAKATDNLGATRSSPPVAITVTGSGPIVVYLHGDHLGTPRVATNEANVVVWRNLPTAEPFGMALPEEDPDGDGRATVINLRFPGQYFDRETQLHYNYFRDYDPGTGRYVQSDPVGLAGGINTYSYVSSDPLRFIDPLGLRGNPVRHTVMGELRRTYQEMLNKNVRGTDQFFHCLAACRATKKSAAPDIVRDKMNQKEWRDYALNLIGQYGEKQLSHDEMIADMNRDKAANEMGIGCPPEIPCEKRCSALLDDLPERRRPHMREYRTDW